MARPIDYTVEEPPNQTGRAAWVKWFQSMGLSATMREPPSAWARRKGFVDATQALRWSQTMLDVVADTYTSRGAYQTIRAHMLDDARAAAVLMTQIRERHAAFQPHPGLEESLARLRAEKVELETAGARDCRALEPRIDEVTLLVTQPMQGCVGNTIVTVRPAPGAQPVSTCDCYDPRRGCAARLAVVNGVIDAVGGAPGPGAEAVRAALLKPAWERHLMVLDSALGELAGQGTLAWGIDPRMHRLEPLRVDASGRKVKITLYPAESAREAASLSDSRHDVALGRLWRGRSQSLNFGAALLELDAHPNVYSWPQKEPIHVKHTPVQLDLVEAPGGFQLVPMVGGRPLQSIVPTGVEIVDGEEVRWWSAPFGVEFTRISGRLGRIIENVERMGGILAREALPGLLERLPRIARVAPVNTRGFSGLVEVEADPAPLLLVEGLAAGALVLSLRVRPLGGGPVFTAGTGVERVVAVSEGEVQSTLRDFGAEVASAESLVARLGLPPPTAEADWLIESPEEALRVVERLGTVGDEARVQWRQRPIRVAGVVPAQSLKVRVAGAGKWFQIGGGATFEGSMVSISALLEAARLGRSFVQVGEGHWARIEEGLRRQLTAIARNAQPASRAADAANQLAGIHAGLIEELGRLGVEVSGDARWRERVERLGAARSLRPVVPAGLNADLRPYQVEGFEWMTRLSHWAGGAVLADDMGLGKTVQALAVLLDRAALGPALVVAPTSVGSNWMREAGVFAPALNTRLHRGSARDKTLGALGPGDVVVVSYDVAVLDQEHWKHRFATVIFDEAHALKNAGTRRARTAVDIPADCRIALTGTPIENRIGELWSLFRAVLPGVFGSAESFRDRWVNPIERDGNADVRADLARLVQPFVLRRTKAEVARELPARTEVRVDVELEPEARARYEELRQATARALQGDDDTPPEKRRFLALVALTRLRQIACHPGLVDKAFIGGSAKIQAMVDLISDLKEEGRRVLVFSQFTEHLRLAGKALTAAGIQFRYFDGSTAAKKRDTEVAAFMAGDGDAFLLSVKAGGVGLNLTAASDVVILDPWWNPAVENQAADRAHRIGQTRAVTIYRLVAVNTVEEQMLKLQEDKRELVAAVLEGTGQGAALTVDEILAILET